MIHCIIVLYDIWQHCLFLQKSKQIFGRKKQKYLKNYAFMNSNFKTQIKTCLQDENIEIEY